MASSGSAQGNLGDAPRTGANTALDGQSQGDNHPEGGEEQKGTQKRAAIDKQSAYLEYKSTSQGKSLENAIVQYREELKQKKLQVKNFTATINITKQEMDRVQERLNQKQEEKRAAEARITGGYGDDDDMDGGFTSSPDNLVIDEEELSLLREMKDLKRSYRDNYEKLKQAKVAIMDAQ